MQFLIPKSIRTPEGGEPLSSRSSSRLSGRFTRRSFLPRLSVVGICFIAVAMPMVASSETKTETEITSFPDSGRSCVASLKEDIRLVERIESFASRFNAHFSVESMSDLYHVAIGYGDRLKALSTRPVDLLHDRCWYDDQLSCATLASSVEDISVFLRTTIEDKSHVAPPIIIESQELFHEIREWCRKKRWNLG